MITVLHITIAGVEHQFYYSTMEKALDALCKWIRSGAYACYAVYIQEIPADPEIFA